MDSPDSPKRILSVRLPTTASADQSGGVLHDKRHQGSAASSQKAAGGHFRRANNVPKRNVGSQDEEDAAVESEDTGHVAEPLASERLVSPRQDYLRTGTGALADEQMDRSQTDQDYFLTVGEDGATVVKPSSRHASENLAARSLSHVELPSLLDDHAHHRRRGIFTPRLHPWEDRERKKTDVEVSSFLLGIKARAGNDPRTRETSFLAMGARLELNNSMEMKLSLNPASPRRGSTLTRTDNNSGDALQAYQNYQVQAGDCNEWLENPRDEPQEASFKETIERRAKARPKHNADKTKSSASSHTGLGSRAERKLDIMGNLAEQGKDLDWGLVERMPSQPGSEHSKERLLSGFSNPNDDATRLDRERGQPDSPTIAGWMSLGSMNGVVKLQNDPAQVKSYTRALTSRERARALGKSKEQNKPSFSPRRITQSLCQDSGFEDLWHRQAAHRSNGASPEQYAAGRRDFASRVAADSHSQCGHSPHAGIRQWNYKAPAVVPVKNEAAVSKQYAQEVLAGVLHQDNLRDSRALLDGEAEGQPIAGQRLVQKPHRVGGGNVRATSRGKSDKPSEDLHDFLRIQVSPKPKSPEEKLNLNLRNVSEQGSRAHGEIVSYEDDVRRAQNALASQGNAMILGIPETTDVHVRQHVRASQQGAELKFDHRPSTNFGRVEDATGKDVRVEKAAQSHGASDHHDLAQLLCATAFYSRLKRPLKVPSSSPSTSILSDAAIKARAHFMLTYVAETDAAELRHCDRVGSTLLWRGSWAQLEHLALNLEDSLGVQKFQGLEYLLRRRPRTSSPDNTYSNKPDATLRRWLLEAEQSSRDGVSPSNGDVRSLHFLPTGVLRQLVAVKSQLFAPLVKQRGQNAFSDGRCALLTGKIASLEYVKGVVLRCPANPAANPANVDATALKDKHGHACKGLQVASEVTMDLILGNGSWSKEKKAKRAKLALAKQQQQQPKTGATAGAPPTRQNPDKPASRGLMAGMKLAAAPDAGNPAPAGGSAAWEPPLANRTPLKMPTSMHQLPFHRMKMQQPLGLPRHMSPRPQGFEEPNQWHMARLPQPDAWQPETACASPRNPQAVSQSLAFDDVGEEEEEERETMVPIRIDSAAQSMLVQDAYRHQCKSETKMAHLGVGAPTPPRTGGRQDGTFSRRHISVATGQQPRAEEGREMLVGEARGHVTVAMGGLMDLFFPPVNAKEPNNRQLPVENDKWGFGGSTGHISSRRDLGAMPISTPGEMGSLPASLLHSLIGRREADAAIALTPRVVDASKHSGHVLKNPLAPSARELALAHDRRAKQQARLERDRSKELPGYITHRRVSVQ